jgi:hypothetical protein
MKFPYTSLVASTDYDVALAAKAGVANDTVQALARELSVSEAALWTGLALGDVRSRGEPLPADAGERVMGLARMIGVLERMRQAQTEPGPVDAAGCARWLGQWLMTPAPGLGGRTPFTLLDTVSGQMAVTRLLQQIAAGVLI